MPAKAAAPPNSTTPGIVSIHNVEDDQGAVYIVSEYIEGQPLASQLRKGRIPFRQAASLVAAVASAVEYAHSKGIVHRDIKPGNIMIDGAGNPRLMDFGLAKREEIDPTITVDDQILGTPAYMSPEQARGKPGQIDRRTDIYSLGATLYHVLTNELPFQGEPREVRDKVLTEEPARPRTIDKTIPVDLETICLKAMEKEPARAIRRRASWPTIWSAGCAASRFWPATSAGPNEPGAGPIATPRPPR